MLEHPGRTFQAETAYSRRAMEHHRLDWYHKPAEYKAFAAAPIVPLPDPTSVETPVDIAIPSDDLWDCVARRRSVRSFSAAPVTLGQLSRLLWASTGITHSVLTAHREYFYRAAPSAGALYPIETYLVVNRVTDLVAGLYHYRVVSMADDEAEVRAAAHPDNPRPTAATRPGAHEGQTGRTTLRGAHALERLRVGDLSTHIARAALDQSFCARAAVVFLWTAVFPRSIWKYRERAYRYVYLDAGHIAAHTLLAAVALRLGSCPVAAFYDDEANALLGIDGREEGLLYLTAVGVPARPWARPSGGATPRADRPRAGPMPRRTGRGEGAEAWGQQTPAPPRPGAARTVPGVLT